MSQVVYRNGYSAGYLAGFPAPQPPPRPDGGGNGNGNGGGGNGNGNGNNNGGNSGGGGGSGQILTWNPADKNAGIQLTNSNKTAGIPGGADILGIVRSILPKTTGKWYWEVVATNVTGPGLGAAVGFANASASLSQELGANANGWGMFGPGDAGNEAMKYHNASAVANTAFRYVDNDILCFALDIAAGLFWFGKNNAWTLSGNPAAGTNATFSSIAAGTYTPACEPYSDSNATLFTIRSFNEASYSAPAGFTYWK